MQLWAKKWKLMQNCPLLLVIAIDFSSLIHSFFINLLIYFSFFFSHFPCVDHPQLRDYMINNLLTSSSQQAQFHCHYPQPFYLEQVPEEYGLSAFGKVFASRGLPLFFSEFTKVWTSYFQSNFQGNCFQIPFFLPFFSFAFHCFLALH